MKCPSVVGDRRGVALITVVLVALAVSSVAIAASLMTMSGTLVRKFSERNTMADNAAQSGVERGLSALLGNDSLLPVTGYTTFEDSQPVLDAAGVPIPGVWRSIYIGPSSDPSRGSIISEVWVRGGVRAVRRLEVKASSFASYGYFVDDDDNNYGFHREEDFYGPVHSNDDMRIWSAGASDTATFWSEVTTAGSIISAGNGSFRQGYNEGVASVSLPSSGDMAGLESLANTANLRFSSTSMGPNTAPVRLEFIAVDMDGNTTTTDDVEGFVRVYSTVGAEDRRYVTAGEVGSGSPLDSPNCGRWNAGVDSFQTFVDGDLDLATAQAAVDSNQYRCYLGGDPTLNDSVFTAAIGTGAWLPWGGIPAVGLAGRRVADVGYDDSGYLHPYSKALNSNSAGVIWVDGDIAVSGVVAGRVTVVANDDIIIVDDLVQYTDPGQNACDADMLGLIAFDDMVLSDNTINTPQRYPGQSYHTMDDTKDEYVQAVAMALSEFRVHNAFSGPDEFDNGGLGAEPCEGIPYGRGCLYFTGGLLQGDRGFLGDGTGHYLRHSFNQCVQQGGPPQFPATGSYTKQRVVEMDGASFDPTSWYTNYQS